MRYISLQIKICSCTSILSCKISNRRCWLFPCTYPISITSKDFTCSLVGIYYFDSVWSISYDMNFRIWLICTDTYIRTERMSSSAVAAEGKLALPKCMLALPFIHSPDPLPKAVFPLPVTLS